MELAPISGAFAGVLLESVGESELVTVAQQMGDGLDGHFCGFQEDFGFFQLLGLDILFGRASCGQCPACGPGRIRLIYGRYVLEYNLWLLPRRHSVWGDLLEISAEGQLVQKKVEVS